MSAMAAVLYGAGDIRIERRDPQPPSKGQATVKIMSTGLCGSDLHYYAHGRNGDFIVQHPYVLGHEASGIITDIDPSSSSSTSLKVGDRVALEVGLKCDSCGKCTTLEYGASDTKGPRYNLCENMRFCSSAKTYPHLDGTLQTFLNHRVDLLHPLPDTCSYELAALAEPLCVVLHAARRARFTESSAPNVLVLGAGAVGLLACSLSIALGAKSVTAIDIDPAKLAFAQDAVKVDRTWQVPLGPKGTPPITDKLEALKKAKETALQALSDLGESSNGAFDIVFECTGVESCIQMAIFMAAVGSRVALVGMGTSVGYLPISAAATREVDLLGVFRYANCYPEALKWLGSGKLNGVEQMVTQRYPLEQTDKAFATLKRGRTDDGGLVVKVMVASNPDPSLVPSSASSRPAVNGFANFA